MKPNIFHYATSELSQDAILLWLINWAKPECETTNKEMHNLGCDFVRLLIDKEIPITSIQTRKQEKDMDITVDINNSIYLVIEDKVGSGIHGDQLSRYRKFAYENYGQTRELCFVYIKTENESIAKLREIQHEEQYRVINRENIIELLKKYEESVRTNDIVSDYYDCLLARQEATDAYMNLPYTEWKVPAWQGFYMELESKMGEGSWHYVNRIGDVFWGFYFSETPVLEGSLYLQIEHNTFCIKLSVNGNKSTFSNKRNKYRDYIKKCINDDTPDICNPRKLGCGKNMTLFVIDSLSLYGTGIVDIDAYVRKIDKYRDLLKRTAELEKEQQNHQI